MAVASVLVYCEEESEGIGMDKLLPDYLSIHRRADPALYSLSPAERESLLAKFAALRNLPPERWAEQGVRKLRPDNPLRLVPFTSELLVFFTPQPEGGFLIEDFVSQGFLDLHARTTQVPVK